jgi:hypothetical protein
MDRDEDHDLRDILEAHWHKPGMVYILGGHDHDISWIERASKTAFSKNLANGRSVGVGFLRKSAIASPELSGDLRDDRPPEFEFEIASNPDTPTSDRSKQDIVENTIEKVRRRSAGKRTDFVRAYERLIHEVADDLGPAFLQRSDHIGQSTFDLVSMASESYAVWPFRTESLALSAEGSISELKVDPRAQEAINRWLIHRDKAVKNRPSAPVTDFSSVASGRMDAREESLRTRSTDFGNFVSDCVQKATRTDIALINSGSFRLDADIDPRITYQTLLDTFLYDRPGAIKVISLSENELGEWLAHSRRSAGSGGFLQISARRGRRSDHDRPLRVAVVAFLVSAKSDDGYLEVLAEVRRCSAKKASASFTSIQPRPESLVEMIAAGAPHVRYCNEPRTVGSEPSARDSITTEGSAIATRIDAYLDACQAAGMSRADSEHALKPLAIGPTEAMAVDAWQALRDSVRRSIADHGNGPHVARLCRHLSRCRRAYESKIDYGRLLSYVWEDVAYTR